MSRKVTKSEVKKRPAGAPRAASRAEPLARVARERKALLDRLEDLGLIDARELETLSGRAGELEGRSLGDGLRKVAAWDRALGEALGRVAAEGPEGKSGAAHAAFVAWLRVVGDLPEEGQALGRALEAFRRVVPYTGATLYLRDPDSRVVRPYASAGFQVDLVSRVRFAEGIGFSAWVATRRKPVLYSALHRNEAPRADQIRSFMAAPIVVAGEALGVLSLAHDTEGAFQPSSLRMLMLAAGALAGPLSRQIASRQIAAREIVDRATGLATPAYFRSRLDEEVLRCRELGYSMSLVTFRPNELSDLSGRFGGEYRDRALVEMGRAILEWKGATEIAGRTGPDRFAVLLPGAGRERAEARARELALLLERISFPRRKRMSVSLGAASYPADAEEAQDLVAAADKAMNGDEAAKRGVPDDCPLVAVS